MRKTIALSILILSLAATATELPAENVVKKEMHPVTVQNEIEFRLEIGKQGETYPIMLRTNDNCIFAGIAALNPKTFSVTVHVKNYICKKTTENPTKTSVKGFVVDNDGENKGLKIVCVERYLNNSSPELCLSAILPVGYQGYVVLTKPDMNDINQ